MFSGIIEEVGKIARCDPTGLAIYATTVLEKINIGDSIAVNGACLTITHIEDDWFHVDTMPETLRRTNLGMLQPDSLVNLELSLVADGRIGGHMVQGHIEAAVPVLEIQEDGIASNVRIAIPAQLRPYLVSKGFVALNGVSLTIFECTNEFFSVALIPFTKEHTNLGYIQPSMPLNLETDVVGRYVFQYLQYMEVAKHLVVRSDSNLKAGLLGAQPMTGDWGVPKSHT
jgi:riboflavin synthase